MLVSGRPKIGFPIKLSGLEEAWPQGSLASRRLASRKFGLEKVGLEEAWPQGGLPSRRLSFKEGWSREGGPRARACTVLRYIILYDIVLYMLYYTIMEYTIV
jgi:hypothetical protein